MSTTRQSLIEPDIANGAVKDIERAAILIGRLDARISASSVTKPWFLRAAWAGYARALQLNGTEIDEIDVFSWGTGVPAPGRASRATHQDEFAAFSVWTTSIARSRGRHWREDLPFTAHIEDSFTAAPLIVRAVEISRQYARAVRSAEPWLALPLLLHRMKVTRRPLPCLVAGNKSLRLGIRDRATTLRRIIADLGDQAQTGLDLLRDLEAERSRAIATLRQTRRPGALATLLAGLPSKPLTTPLDIANSMDLSISGAGKLLARAEALGLLAEVTGRQTWRQYVTPEIAARLGYRPALRGRPRTPLTAPPSDIALSSVLADFDREMEAFNARFGVDTPEPDDDEDL